MDRKKNISEWDLQQYLIGELPSVEMEVIRGRVLCDDGLRARLDALRASHAEIKAQYPTAWMARKLQLRTGNRTGANRVRLLQWVKDIGANSVRPPQPLWTRVAVPVFACIAVMIAIPVYMSSTNAPMGERAYSERIKGDGNLSERVKGVDVNAPELQVWRRTASDPERLTQGVVAKQGDILQLWYVVPDICYGTLVSVDGRGVLTVHLPKDGGKATLMTPGHAVSLPSAYRLDDAPHYEAFYLITSSDEFDLESVKKTLRSMGGKIADAPEISLPDKQVTAFKLRKPNGKGS